LRLIRSAALKLIQQAIYPVNILNGLRVKRMPFFIRLIRRKLLLPALQQVEITTKDVTFSVLIVLSCCISNRCVVTDNAFGRGCFGVCPSQAMLKSAASFSAAAFELRSNSLAVKSITSPSAPQPKRTVELSTKRDYSIVNKEHCQRSAATASIFM
jgi:hypothetical protein